VLLRTLIALADRTQTDDDGGKWPSYPRDRLILDGPRQTRWEADGRFAITAVVIIQALRSATIIGCAWLAFHGSWLQHPAVGDDAVGVGLPMVHSGGITRLADKRGNADFIEVSRSFRSVP